MIVIGEPPLGPQTHDIMIGSMKSGNIVIQTDNGWVTIPLDQAGDVALAIGNIVIFNKEKGE